MLSTLIVVQFSFKSNHCNGYSWTLVIITIIIKLVSGEISVCIVNGVTYSPPYVLLECAIKMMKTSKDPVTWLFAWTLVEVYCTAMETPFNYWKGSTSTWYTFDLLCNYPTNTKCLLIWWDVKQDKTQLSFWLTCLRPNHMLRRCDDSKCVERVFLTLKTSNTIAANANGGIAIAF